MEEDIEKWIYDIYVLDKKIKEIEERLEKIEKYLDLVEIRLQDLEYK